MSYPYGDPDMARLPAFVRVLFGTVRLGRWSDVEVRIFTFALLVMPLLFLAWLWPVSGGWLEAVVLTALAFVGLFAIVWTHEMGHVLAGRHFGIWTPLITLSPLGGLAHMGAPARSPRQEILISLAGPAVHLVWLAVCWPLRWLLPYGTVSVPGFNVDPVGYTLDLLITTNFQLCWFNLLPFFPLDGGRVFRAALAHVLHPNRATLIATTVGLVGGGALIVYGLSSRSIYGTISVFLGFRNIQACLQERRAARQVLVYGDSHGESREVWQSDPDAWKTGQSIFRDAGSREPARRPRAGWLARWRARRAEASAAKRRAADQAFERELDQVLARLHEVGMGQLSAQERKVLQRAAERRRGAG